MINGLFTILSPIISHRGSLSRQLRGLIRLDVHSKLQRVARIPTANFITLPKYPCYVIDCGKIVLSGQDGRPAAYAASLGVRTDEGKANQP